MISSRRFNSASALLVLVAAIAACQAPPREEPPGAPVRAGLSGYDGSEFCKACHPKQYDQWEGTLHARTVHPPSDAERDLLRGTLLCGEYEPKYVLGLRHSQRFMLESDEEEGVHVLLPCRYDIAPGTWTNLHESEWRGMIWERSCGACHTTGFSSDDLGYVDIHVGCESCHGPGSRHGDYKKTADMIVFELSSGIEEVVICASCHLQGGRSRKTGLNFAYNYEAGADLFEDYDYDWAQLDRDDEDIENPIDVHQKIVIKDAMNPSGRPGALELRCTSCHRAHTMEHSAHETLPRDEFCYLCHARDDFKLKEYSQACNVCEF
jgi:predicted CXXCH cytochrome family protein